MLETYFQLVPLQSEQFLGHDLFGQPRISNNAARWGAE